MFVTTIAPLGIKENTPLTPSQEIALRKIEAYDFWFVKEIITKKGSISEEKIDLAIDEFRKFLVLVHLYEKKFSMTSKEVDTVWHTFILFTKEYYEFCNDTFGKILHHIPQTSRTPVQPNGKQFFYKAYKNTFGDIPDIWLSSISSECDDDCGSDSCDGEEGGDE